MVLARQVPGVAELNGNLVPRFRDTDTGAEYFSFLGTRAPGATVRALLAAAPCYQVEPRLRLVPEEVIAHGTELRAAFAVEEDQDADYLLSIPAWATLDGSTFKRARYNVADFGRRYHASFRPLDLADAGAQRAMLDLFDRWAAQKGVTEAAASVHERAALERLFGLAPHPALGGYGLTGDDGLLAFLVCETRDIAHVVLHYWKADRAYRGVYMHSLHHCCLTLAAEGRRVLNIGQDLGDGGMAAAKHSFRPSGVLRKYAISV